VYITGGWCQEGHIHRKTSHQNPYFKGQPANPHLPGKTDSKNDVVYNFGLPLYDD